VVTMAAMVTTAIEIVAPQAQNNLHIGLVTLGVRMAAVPGGGASSQQID
jgi:hypothetical protein